MAQQIVNNGDTGLASRNKINGNFTELFAGGPETIVEISTFPYTHLGTEDIIIATGTGTINMIAASAAIKSFTVVSKTGTITMNPDGTDTIQQSTVTSGSALRAAPETGGWVSA